MGAILDYIASVIIFGVLVLSVGRIQTNVNATMYQNTFSVVVQQNAVELARQLEFDLLKMGHRVRGQRMFTATSRSIRFRADLRNNWDTVMVTYAAGIPSQATQTANPRDFPLFRDEAGTSIRQNWGLVQFSFTYFDSLDLEMPAPITTTDSLGLIRSVRARFTVASPEPVIGPLGDSTWASVEWEKLIYPRNLGQINLSN